MNPLKLLAGALAVGVLMLSLAATGCDDAEDGDASDVIGDGDAIDTDEILNSLEEVRTMLDSASSLDPAIVQGVAFADGTLVITAEHDSSEIDEAARLCEEAAEAIGLIDLTIVVNTADGDELARCFLESDGSS